MTLETTCWCWWSFWREAWTISLWPEQWQGLWLCYFIWQLPGLGQTDKDLDCMALPKQCHGWILSEEDWLTEEQKVLRKLRPGFLRKSVVRFSRGHTAQKSRVRTYHKSNFAIFNSHNGKFIKLQGKTTLWKYWGLLLDKSETQREPKAYRVYVL